MRAAEAGSWAASARCAARFAKLPACEALLPARDVKARPAFSDTQSVRIALTHKFVFGSLVVGAAVVGLPAVLLGAGLDVSSWISPFVVARQNRKDLIF